MRKKLSVLILCILTIFLWKLGLTSKPSYFLLLAAYCTALLMVIGINTLLDKLIIETYE